VRAASLHGRCAKSERARGVADLAAGELEAVASTYQLIGEGFDSPRLDTLFRCTPVSFEGRVIQALGRVSRTAAGKTDSLVLDCCDNHPMLWSSWGKRTEVYRKMGLTLRYPSKRESA
jgi:superfamily II DNA or RNA helicase